MSTIGVNLHFLNELLFQVHVEMQLLSERKEREAKAIVMSHVKDFKRLLKSTSFSLRCYLVVAECTIYKAPIAKLRLQIGIVVA